MQVWQVAAGDGSRDYSDVFLRFGVMLVGPGSIGEYFHNREEYNDPKSWAYRSFMRPFAEQVEVGDLIILKRSSGYQWEIIAVGEVISRYLYRDVFGDVEGWDLQHCRQVQWKVPKSSTVISGLTRGTLKRVNSPSMTAMAQEIWSTGLERSSHPIPPEPNSITLEEVVESLIVEGMPGQTAEIVANTLWRLRRMAKYYQTHGADVGEHEIRTFLIVPLLLSLGWAEQRIKIEWWNMDIVLFDSVYKKEISKPIVIVESKRLFHGMRYAHQQAKDYAISHPSCLRFIISDGIRYKLFTRENDSWRFEAYMSLTTPTRDHPYETGVKGAIPFFLSMVAANIQ